MKVYTLDLTYARQTCILYWWVASSSPRSGDVCCRFSHGSRSCRYRRSWDYSKFLCHKLKRSALTSGFLSFWCKSCSTEETKLVVSSHALSLVFTTLYLCFTAGCMAVLCGVFL